MGRYFYIFLLGAGQFAIVWLERERGFGIGEISATYGLIYITFGTAGTFLGGMLSDWYQSRYKGGKSQIPCLLNALHNAITHFFSLCFAHIFVILYWYGGGYVQRKLVLWPGIFNRTRPDSGAIARGYDRFATGRL